MIQYIYDYANKKDYKNLLSKFNLNDNGVVLSYIFSHVKKYSDFLDMCEVKEDSKEDRGVLIYKQLLQTIFQLSRASTIENKNRMI